MGEEAGEFLTVGGKLMGNGGQADHWDGTNLHQRLMEELADLDAAVAWFIGRPENFTEEERSAILRRKREKMRLFDTWNAEQGETP